MKNHEAWKQIFIRDQWFYDELRDEFKLANWQAKDNDSAKVACIGS